MNSPLLSVLVLSLTAFSLAACSTAPTGDVPVAKAAPEAVDSYKDMPFPKLEKGTTAEVIRQKLGEPVEIQPMPSPDGKAEVWIYKFQKDLGMVQVAAGTRDVEMMTMSSTMSGSTTVKEPVYTMAAKTADITLSLLMFNGQLQVQKAKVEESITHN